jgi:ubiquinone/menaquinone biosynthesis C-methylase UbiE
MTNDQRKRRICEYEGADYRTEFWSGRDYEDLAERIALKKLLPKSGSLLLDIGAGFGRLAELYTSHKRIFLLDYSESMLRQAKEKLGTRGDFIYIAASIYELPFPDSVFDTTITIRMLHHIEDIPSAFEEVGRVLKTKGLYILEYANKRNLKAILRYFLRLQSWNPFSPEPYEFVKLNFNFHPSWIEENLKEAGFEIESELAVSIFRIPLLKRLIPPRYLAALDGLLQRILAPFKPTPSVFLSATKQFTPFGL